MEVEPQKNRTMISPKLRCLVFAILLIVCGGQIYHVIRDFITGEKWTNSILMKDVSDIEFPYVTICNYNQANVSKLDELGASEKKLQEYIEDDNLTELYRTVKQELDYMSLQDHFLATVFVNGYNPFAIKHKSVANGNKLIEDMTIGRHLYRRFINNHRTLKNISDVLFALAIPCRSSIFMCSFFGVSFDCCLNSRQIMRDMGSCFIIRPPNLFDISQPPVQTSQGNTFGMQFYALLYPSIGSGRIVNNYLENGLRLYVSYEPQDVSTDHFSIPVGFHTFVALEKIEETTIDPIGFIALQEKTCTIQHKTSFGRQNYSVIACHRDCMIEIIHSLCKCVHASDWASYMEIAICEPDDNYGCVMPKLMDKWSELTEDGLKLGKRFNVCKLKCKQPCHEHRIETSLSMAKVPTQAVVSQLIESKRQTGSNISERDLTNGMLAVDLYFKRMSVQVIEKYPKATLDQMIGNIGGLIGLWLGASVFSMIELVKVIPWGKICSALTKTQNNVKPTEIKGAPEEATVTTLDHYNLFVTY